MIVAMSTTFDVVLAQLAQVIPGQHLVHCFAAASQPAARSADESRSDIESGYEAMAPQYWKSMRIEIVETVVECQDDWAVRPDGMRLLSQVDILCDRQRRISLIVKERHVIGEKPRRHCELLESRFGIVSNAMVHDNGQLRCIGPIERNHVVPSDE